MDLIIKNARIVTMDAKISEASALAVKNGEFIKVGSDEEILALREDNTKVLDLKGKMVVPGFNDSHMHLLHYGLSKKQVDLNGSKSIDEIISRINRFIKEKGIRSGQWVEGSGWNQDYFDVKKFPTRYDLDKISAEEPICIARVCYHIAVVNSKALEIMGINRESQQIEGGVFDMDENGEPTGIFRENAVNLIYKCIPEPSIEDIKNAIIEAVYEANKQGITSVQTDDFGALPSNDYEKIISAYKTLIQEDRLNVRINEQCLLPEINKIKTFFARNHKTGEGDAFFKIGPLKLLTDGSLGARTALLCKPYEDAPDTAGVSIFSQDELDELVLTAHNRGMQVAIHCIGDKAMAMAFDSIEKAQRQSERKEPRHAIIHCQITDEALLDRFKKLDVIAHIQPIFLEYDLHIVEDRVGKVRAKTTYNWKTMLDKGIHVACGSDCPVEKFDVLPNIYCAVTRKDLEGYPENGWLPEQKLSVDEALYGFTMGGAYASFEEDIKGSISEGKLADFVVLSEDIYKIEPEKIKDVEVLMTFLGGRLVYKSKLLNEN